MTDIWVLIVNYNSANFCEKAVESVAKERTSLPQRLRCIIVDNGSLDESVKKLTTLGAKPTFADWVDVLASKDNAGFGAGNNIGFQFAKQHSSFKKECFFLLLNPDAVLETDALKILLEAMSQKPRAGAMGPKILNTDGSPHPSSFRFPSWLRQGVEAIGSARIEALFPTAVSVIRDTKNNELTDWISGACMFLRGKAIPDTGFDENYFLYFEEVDLCWEIHKSGWEVWHCPSARVTHIRGQSTGWNSERDPEAPWSPHWFRSRRYFLRKRYGFFYRLACDITVGGLLLTRRILEDLGIARRRPRPKHFLFHLFGLRTSFKPREKA